MLNEVLKDWRGELDIDDKHYMSVEDATSVFNTLSESTHIKLYSKQKRANVTQIDPSNQEYMITVRAYMTREATPEFDFMSKWNKNVPMPLRTMVGTEVKETKGMVYMKLHGQAEPVVRCMRCGRLLTNPISKHYGIGPECMNKLGFVCDIDDVDTIKKKLVDVTWEGWIIKSSILEKEPI